jgi:hypothetical protein
VSSRGFDRTQDEMMMKVLTLLATISALALTCAAVPTMADARVRHHKKHNAAVAANPAPHRPHRSYRPGDVIYGERGYDGGYGNDDRGYRYGGPLYSTCDRINSDRMLVGTCR